MLSTTRCGKPLCSLEKIYREVKIVHCATILRLRRLLGATGARTQHLLDGVLKNHKNGAMLSCRFAISRY
jgi:hypothetical protein